MAERPAPRNVVRPPVADDPNSAEQVTSKLLLRVQVAPTTKT